MAKSQDSHLEPRRPPATTPEGREHELINVALDEAERQMRNGTASAQVLVHFLKLASSKDRLEREKIRMDTQYRAKQIENMNSQAAAEELYENAINAMRTYSGSEGTL